MKSALEIAKEVLDARKSRALDTFPESGNYNDWYPFSCVFDLAEAVVKLTEENEEPKKVVDQWPWDEKDGGWFIIKKKGVPAAAEAFLLEFKQQSQALKEAMGIVRMAASTQADPKHDRPIYPHLIECAQEWLEKYGTKK